VFDCTCNTQYSLLLNQHNGDDAPQKRMFGHNINEKNDGSVHLGVSYQHFLQKNNNMSDINKILNGLQVS